MSWFRKKQPAPAPQSWIAVGAVEPSIARALVEAERLLEKPMDSTRLRRLGRFLSDLSYRSSTGGNYAAAEWADLVFDRVLARLRRLEEQS